MSLITDDPEKSPRDCSRKRHHQHHGSRGWRRGLIAASGTVASLLSLAVILWLTLRPSSPPHFSLVAATASNNASVIVVDVAFTARNPNAHAAALYDQLQASASYAGVPLGAGAALPRLEQPAEGDVMMSALLKSSPGTKEKDGAALLRTRIQGQLRWKVANWWVSGRHGLAVDCVAVVPPSVELGSLQSECATHVTS